ncbi:MAG: hypothetical protein AAFY56_06095, partial [Pseudomonadota bacterium]
LVLLDLETARCDQANHAIVHYVENAGGRPIVLMITPDKADDIEEFLRLGIAECIIKSRPLHLNLLPQAVRLIASQANRAGSERRLGQEQRLIAQVFAGVMATVGEAIIATDGRGRILRVSSAAKSLIGNQETEFSGQEIDALLRAGDGEPIGPRLAALEADDGVRIEPLMARHKEHDAGGLQATIRAFSADPDDTFCILVMRKSAVVGPAVAATPVAKMAMEEDPTNIPQPLEERLAELANNLSHEGALATPELWHLRLDGIHKARQSLGGAWHDMEPVVNRVIDGALRAELNSEDAFAHDRQGDIIFHLAPKFGVNHLRRASRTIQAVQRAVLTTTEIDQAALDADTPLPATTRQEMARLDANMQAVPLRPLGGLTSETALATVSATLWDQISALPHEAARHLQNLALSMSADLAMVQAHTGEPSSLQLFAPDLDARDRLRQLYLQGRDHPEIVHQVNLLMLSQAAGAMLEDMAGDDALTVVDLDVEALAHRRLAEGVIDFAAGLPEVLRRTLVINLSQLPAGFFLPRIQEISVRLASISAFRAIEITDLRAELPDLENARIPLVIVPYKQIEGQLRTQSNLLARFITRAHDQHARVLVRNVSRQLSLRIREETDVDLVCRA